MTTDPTFYLETATGYVFPVRPAEPEDEKALAEFFKHVTRDDLRFRFLSAVKTVSASRISEMTHVDHRLTEDFLARDPETGAVIASAMLAADKTLETAEVAVSVHSDYKDKGLEAALLDHIRRTAKGRGIKKLMSIENRENRSTIDLESSMGFSARGVDGDPTLVVLEKVL